MRLIEEQIMNPERRDTELVSDLIRIHNSCWFKVNRESETDHKNVVATAKAGVSFINSCKGW